MKKVNHKSISCHSPAQWRLLLLAAGLTVLLWRIPYGNYLLYPFSVLATWFHEMGHGLAASMLGGRFEKLVMYSDGSGLAYYSSPADWGRLRTALVSASGPMGAPVAGAVLILASSNRACARAALWVLGLLIAAAVVLWVRSIYGVVVLPLIAGAILAAAARGSSAQQSFTAAFLGVQACISTYKQLDYLFTKEVVIDGVGMLSDSGKLGSLLLLPYWFWGGAMAVFAAMLLLLALYWAYPDTAQEEDKNF